MHGQTIPEALAEVVRRFPDRVACQIKQGAGYIRYTYAQLDETVATVQAALARDGIGRGHRVAILSENRPAWAMAYFGSVAAGATVVPLDVQLPQEEIRLLLAESGSRLVFASGRMVEQLQQAGVRLPCVDFDAASSGPDCTAFSAWLTPSPGASGHATTPNGPRPDDAASLLYTSGTTATPKGVLLSHRNLLSNAEGILQGQLASEEDNFLAVLPLHHTYPFMIALLVPLMCGARVTFLQSLKGPDMVACLQETGITVLVGVPQLYTMLLRAVLDRVAQKRLVARLLFRMFRGLTWWCAHATRLHPGTLLFGQLHRRFGGRIRILASGGARLDPEIAKGLVSLGFTVLEGYGLTETSPVVTFNLPERPKLGSVGKPIQGVEVVIVDPDPSGIGEVVVRGPNVMLGYDRQPGATAEAIKDGWFTTGDQGYLDPDGYLVLTGRLKEVIVLGGGKNVYPEEVEQHYQQSRFIQELCVLGVEGDQGGGEQLHAVIIPDLQVLRAEGIPGAREAIHWELKNLSRILPAYRRIMQFEVIKEPLPRTRLGKIKRYVVQEQYRARRRLGQIGSRQAAHLPADDPLLAHEVTQQLLAWLATFTGRHGGVGLDDHLELDLGLDSLRLVELLVALEERFGITVPDSVEAEVFTVRDIVEKLLLLVHEQPHAFPGLPPAWREVLRIKQVEPLVLDAPWTRWLFARTVLGAIRLLLRLGWRFRVHGLEHLPPDGPVILTPNHLSYLDGFIVAAAVPPRQSDRLFFLSETQFFRGRLLTWFARAAHVIVAEVLGRPLQTLQLCTDVLRQGRVLCMFPEGGISLDGVPMPFKKGVGILIRELDVPVIPVALHGTSEALPQGARWPRLAPIEVTFGRPLHAKDLPTQAYEAQGLDEYDALVAALRDEVHRLIRRL